MDIVFILLLVISAIGQAAGSALLKYATSFKTGERKNKFKFRLFAGLSMLAFFLSGPLYALGLSRMSLSVAQPVFSAVMFLTTTLISILIFKDVIKRHQAAGIAVILAGIIAVIS